MIGELIAIIEKNFRRLIRSKLSALIILLGPLVLIGIIGLAFSSSGIYGIIIGVHSESYNEVTNLFIDNLEGKEFSIVEYENKEDCIDSVRTGKSHICISFPNEINFDNRIEFHVDYSRLNLVFTLLEIVSAKISGQSKQISLGLVSELIDKMHYTIGKIEDNAGLINELKSEAEQLGVKIVDVQQEVENLDMDFDLQSMNFSSMKQDVARNKGMISTYENRIERQIATNRAKLKQFRQDAVNLKTTVDAQIVTKNNIKKNVDESYIAQGCASQTVVDLTPYLEDSDTLNSMISSLTNPTCSFLYTIKSNVDQTGNDLDATSQKLGTLINEIDGALAELDKFEIESRDTFAQVQIELFNAEERFGQAETSIDDAEERLGQMNSSKQDFASELDNISGLVNNNLEKFDLINNAMTELTSNIKNISVLTPDSIINPISTEVKPLTTNKKTLDYLFPSLLILIIMFVSILLSSSLVMREKSSNATFRNLIAPINNYVYVLGTFLTSLFITMIQILIIVLIASLFFNMSVFQNFGTVLIIIILIISIFSCIGIIISNLFKSEETSTIASIILACIFFMFSSTIVPIEKMSATMAMFARANPFVVAEFLLSKAFLFNKTLASMSGDLIVILIQLIVLGGLAVWSFKAFKYEEEG
ncbi:MAG: ABC transporter permease, partial [Nanoarchaeota archaeon]|nr:ABC transporter permease [Nanoarchaeota archaeon]MBU1322106.1 ABC transporter permease [Nanoarchaeota archaeon]MBU1597427.1 ABC transporter permease [Nanoarchaeota archaeon]MBU2441929.1 ABC transporter permease [Nanoarchaeota archaeon]